MIKYFQVYLLYLLVLSSIQSFEYEDLAARAVFPPKVEDSTSNEPTGHKKPLGYQRPPDGPVQEYTKSLDAQTFWKSHVKPHVPLVYRGVIKDSPAISLWTDDEYLAEHYGDLDVLVEHKKEDRSSTSGRMAIRDFLKHYKTDDLYVVTMFPTEMMHEVRAINSVLCGTFRNYTHESNLWISAGGTRSVAHYDADHNLHCVIDGRKDFIMIANNLKTKTNLYFKQKDRSVGSGFSFLDPDNIDMKKFPRIAQVPWTWASLYPGDCIFIPEKYIHQVRGYGRTLAVTTLFTTGQKNRFSSEGCTEEIMTGNYTMADIPFLWTYNKGDATIDMGYMNTDMVKNTLLDEFRDKRYAKDGKMSMKQFVAFSEVLSPFGKDKTKMHEIWKGTFELGEDDFLDAEKVRELSLHQLKEYCRTVEAPHGVVTNGSEPVFVRPGERHKWEHQLQNDREEGEENDFDRIVNRDNMLEHLSPEELEEYVKQKVEAKKKLGLKYKLEDEFLKAKDLSEEQQIMMELSWHIEDIPEKYRNAIKRGKIPKAFRDEFVDALPESLQKRYSEYLKEYKLPVQMVRALIRESETEDEEEEEVMEKLRMKDEEKKKKKIVKDEF